MQLVTIATPRPGADELLVRVAAASLNPVDWKIRDGKYPPVPQNRLPYVMGRDFSGEVVERGRGIDGFAEGDAVYGLMDIARGSFADYVVVRAGELSARPATLGAVDAAAVPLAGLTAWQGLFRHGGLVEGQRVLIHAGAGGVGHLAVQFARARGAHVIATAATANVGFVHGLGADEVIDYKSAKFEDQVSDVDLVYDLIGGETQERSWSVLRRGGTLVSTLQEPSQDKARSLGVRALRYTAESSASDLREIASSIDAGRVRVTVSKVSPMKDARSALEAVEQGHMVGKALLVMTAER